MNFDTLFWAEQYYELWAKDDYPHSDELREMLRRMGYELRLNRKEKRVVIHQKWPVL
jgi:hypothetical protein